MNLRVECVRYPVGKRGQSTAPVLFFRCAVTGEELGSYVPATRSCRVGPTMHKGVADEAAAFALFAAYARSLLPARAAQPER